MPDQYPAAGLRHIRGHDHSAIMASIDILTEAFRDDPVMVYFSSRSGVGKDDFLLGNIICVLVKSHMARGEPLWGYYHQGRLIGCALVDTRMSAWRTTLGALRCWRNWLALPFATIRKLAAYRAISGTGVPSGVTHFLVMIAIAPAARGMGHGGEFLRALEAASPIESYWALDTENPANVPLYEHLGYDLYDEAQLDDIRVYKMQKRLFQAACRSPSIPQVRYSSTRSIHMPALTGVANKALFRWPSGSPSWTARLRFPCARCNDPAGKACCRG